MVGQENYERAFQKLRKSRFRSRFHLSESDRRYIAEKGIETIRRHCEDFVRTRLAPANPPNDGRQTPMRGHPVFVAQHACACCCRSCLAKWHGIPAGRELSQEQQDFIVSLLMAWIGNEMSMPAPAARQDRARRRKAAEAFQLSLLDGD